MEHSAATFERGFREDRTDDIEVNGNHDGDVEMEDVDRDHEKSRESGKQRSKDKKRDRDHVRSRDSERLKERGKDDLDKDRVGGRERRKEEERDEKDKDKSRDKGREKGHDRDKHREKERELERGKDRVNERDRERGVDREREHDKDREREHERGKDRGRDKGREHDKDRDMEKDRSSDREHERGKEREKVYDHGRDRDKDHEKDRERDRGIDRSKGGRERDHEKEFEKELERERGKVKARERGKERDREREKDRDRTKDREREKVRDREKEEKERAERNKPNEKVRSKEKERTEGDRRTRERERESEREVGSGKEDEEVDRRKTDNGDIRDSVKQGNKVHDDGDVLHARFISKDGSQNLVESQPSTAELEQRITKMKEERLNRKSDGASEISSWVSKSRKLEEKISSEKEMASRRLKDFEEQDNIQGESEEEEASECSGSHLAGVKVLHGLDKVIEGGAVVLTLKDQNILADGDINEEVDMLENVEMGEQKRRDEAYRAAKKKTGIYEDKFSEDMGYHKPILPQYDDQTEDEGVTLDESGSFTGEAEKKLEELRKKIQGGSVSKNFEDLTSLGKTSSDYYTSEEMVQFKKPKKKKSLRKKEKLDLDALEAEAISAGLGAGDLGSRRDAKTLSAREKQEKAEAEMRSKAYQSAFAKAEEASKALQQPQTLTVKVEEDENPVFGEDYEDLQKSLEQARKLALNKQDGAAASGPQAVALQIKAKNEQVDEPASGELQENKVVITEMEEFVLGLQLNEDTRKPDSEDVFMDEEDVPSSEVGVKEEPKDEAGGWTEGKEMSIDELPVSEEKEEIVPDETIHEIAVGKGLSGALKLLKERGTLKESIEWGGRNMDKKKSKLVGIYENEGLKEIRIERTDEFGRIMTPKEAFRMISHKFHGKGPGKMKQEKRVKQYQEELKLKRMKASDTPSQSMERMREAQARLKTPYLVLSGHVKPGQTSDPRSGFATVEKDHPGSLTPMLGDRKVEHFLGIKRKSDPGSMGPPPPKKAKS